ncbi:MAG TPA: formyltransferase family protein [Chitinophagaceae bacterium]|nr:formyltransferase family protein [Chitinophagaceae bacterium]
MKVNKQKDLKILFIGKADDFYSRQAADFVLVHYPTAEIIFSERQQPFPDELFNWKGDLIISYLSQWIIPGTLLKKAAIAALNFHPGPPAYPGIGCTNFAIYDNVDEFGVTCHHMAAKVDTGQIVAVKRFPVYETDTVYSITQQCYNHILDMFYDIFSLVMNGKNIPVSEEIWERKPYLRKELDDLCKLTPEMDIAEIERRIKATHYIQPWAFMQLGNKSIKLSEDDIKTRRYLAFLSQPNMS